MTPAPDSGESHVLVDGNLTEEGVEAIEVLASAGLSLEGISGRLGVSRRALGRIREAQPVVAQALARGRSHLEEELAGCLVNLARKGNVAAVIFALKNLGWSDSPLNKSVFSAPHSRARNIAMPRT